jgi:hypothetical protein
VEEKRIRLQTTFVISALLLITVIFLLIWFFTPYVLGEITGQTSLHQRALLGEQYTASGALFSSLALIGVIVAIAFQSRTISLQRHELNRSAEVDLRSLHLQLLMAAIGDSDLLDVWTYDGDAERSATRSDVKKELYSNLIISHVETSFVTGLASSERTRLQLEELFESPIIRQFWREVSGSRQEMDIGTNSEAIREFVQLGNQALSAVERRRNLIN